MSEERGEKPNARRESGRTGFTDGVDRREFLRTVGSVGCAYGVARLVGIDDVLSASGEVEVVTALVRDDDSSDPWAVEERTTDVPARWYESVEKAIEVNEALARTSVPGYLGSAVVPGDYDEGATVSVGVSVDASSVRDILSGITDAISIEVEEFDDVSDIGRIDGIGEFDGGTDTSTYEPRFAEGVTNAQIASGVACETSSSLATLAPALYDPEEGGSYFVTASHAFDVEGTENGDRQRIADAVRDEQLSLPTQGDESVELGTVRFGHPVQDVALVDPVGPLSPPQSIDAPEPIPVRGQLTKYGLADVIARGESLEKVGAMSGHTTGDVEGMEAITCFTDPFCRRGQIRWGSEMDLVDGDSGSVSYYPDPGAPDDGALIAGFNNARTWWPGQSYVWGVAAYRITAEHGYHF
ncbi:hypothetical protein ACFQGT_12350 [Natrialbaceae archaeon GCM10025810]|uniref:hypothetical protein n=1 Tax=Halovalidus salilacus TaxID=3075124 RepID=UPI003609A9AE